MHSRNIAYPNIPIVRWWSIFSKSISMYHFLINILQERVSKSDDAQRYWCHYWYVKWNTNKFSSICKKYKWNFEFHTCLSGYLFWSWASQIFAKVDFLSFKIVKIVKTTDLLKNNTNNGEDQYCRYQYEVKSSYLQHYYNEYDCVISKQEIIKLTLGFTRDGFTWWFSSWINGVVKYFPIFGLIKTIKFLPAPNHPILSTTMVIIFWDFLMFYPFFLSPQVRWSAIIINNDGTHKFSHELLNDFRLRN